MDEIFDHIGIVMLIIISVVAQIVKVAKKASGSEETPSVETDTPSSDSVFEHTFTAPTKTKKQKKTKISSHKPLQSAGHTAAEEQNSRVADTPEAKPAVSVDDFDIRQAIIYSEIMTPKFKEE